MRPRYSRAVADVEIPQSTAPSGARALPAHFGHKPALDGLRAIAVLTVIAYHFGAGWLQGGFLGVDLFFVLSGYLITSLLIIEHGREGRIALGAFWGRRMKRLMPALMLVLAAVMVWGRFMTDSTNWGQQRVDALWSLLYGANWHFIVSGQSYFTEMPSMLRHMWSLAIEEQFYLVWPMVVIGALWLAKGRLWALASLCIAGALASAWWMSHLWAADDPSRAYYGTDSRASQLMLGALCGIALLRWAPRTNVARAFVQWFGTACFAAVMVMMVVARDRDSWMYSGGFLLFAVLACGSIVAFSQSGPNPVARVLSLRPIRWIGAVSYGLYLWHWPVSVAMSPARLDSWGLPDNTWFVAVVRLALTFAIAALSYYLLEMPIRRHRFTRNQSWVVAPLTILATIALIIGASWGATQGLLDRRSGTLVTSGPVEVADAESPLNQLMTHAVVMGDSVAASLGDALAVEAAKRGVTLETFARLGCGITTAPYIGPDGVIPSSQKTCVDGVLPYEKSVVNDHGADVLIVHSSWEISPLATTNGVVQFDSPGWRTFLTSEYERILAMARARGMKVVLVANAPPASSPLGDPPADSIANGEAMNAFYRSFAAAHPNDVVVVELGPIVCPDGVPCPRSIGGTTPRPKDGGHYGGDLTWVANGYLDALQHSLERLK